MTLFASRASSFRKSPNDVALLTQMTIIGVDQARNKNPKFVPQSVKYGALAIELIETNKKPESMDAAAWTDYQTRWLPTLYQYLGLVSLMSNEKDEARARLQKASEINANDPYNYMYLGILANQEYQQLAEEHKKVGSGPLKEESLKVAQAKMDEVIEPVRALRRPFRGQRQASDGPRSGDGRPDFLLPVPPRRLEGRARPIDSQVQEAAVRVVQGQERLWQSAKRSSVARWGTSRAG